MRQVLFAILLLALIAAATGINIAVISKSCNDVEKAVDSALGEIKAKNWNKAEQIIKDAAKKWKKDTRKLRHCVRESDITALSEALIILLGDIWARNTAASFCSAEAVQLRTDRLRDMELGLA